MFSMNAIMMHDATQDNALYLLVGVWVDLYTSMVYERWHFMQPASILNSGQLSAA